MACVLLPSWKQEEHPISLTPVGWCGAVANACTPFLVWGAEEREREREKGQDKDEHKQSSLRC